MCGIFGYLDNDSDKKLSETSDKLLGGLEKMEYRGYDSAGLCILGQDKSIYHIKSVGRVENLRSKIKDLDSSEASKKGLFLGIAHTRWATHGKSSETNAHPVRSCKENKFLVVHNGIISNFLELKKMLIEKGYEFETQTDTEVASKLALYFYEQDKSMKFKDIVRKVVDHCNGAFAMIFISPIFPEEMIAVRSKAPIIIGTKTFANENLMLDKSMGSFNLKANGKAIFVVSSDISAIIEITDNLIYLEDDDLAIISKKGVSIIPGDSKSLVRARMIVKADAALDSVLKGNYAHFMLKEINEQSESILNTIRNRIDFEDKTVVLNSLESHREKLKNATRYIFIACGTSYNSCQATKKIFEELTDCPVSVEIASHFMDLNCQIYPNDVAFFISQSGETFDTLSAMEYCNQKGAFTVAVTNNAMSTMAKEASCRFDLNAGIEKSVASTKAYTSQFMSIILIGLFISQEKGLHPDKRAEIISEIAEVPEKIRECLKMDVDHFVNELNMKDSMIVIGRGYQAATCLEGSLKIKEISYIHCEGILAGELKHGPLALVSADKHIMVIIANDDHYHKSHSALEQIQARGAIPFIVCTNDLQHQYAKSIAVPKTLSCLQGLLTVIPFQLISYKLALKKGIDPDYPRNLAKSVTVE